MLVSDTLRRMLGQWIEARCALCFDARAPEGLCADCRGDLPWLPTQRCPVCALPTPGGTVCGVCLKSPPAYDATACAVAYAFPVDALVQALKYQGRLAAVRPLADILAAAVAGLPAPDLVVPVPLSPGRLAERGFNQALELARALGPKHAGRIDPHSLERPRETVPQAGLPFAQRRRNVRGSFHCSANLSGARVALVDDVMTTGATLDEAARALKRAGAVEVRNWVVARTPRAP